MADDKLLLYVTTIVLLLGVTVWEWVRWYFNAPYVPRALTILAVPCVVFAIWRIVLLRRRFAALKLGRDGERIVAENLTHLRSHGPILFHDNSRRRGAEVRFDGKTLTVDGRRPDRDPIEQVRAIARWVGSTIRESTGKAFSIKPVVVFPGWFVNPVKEQGGSDVWVLTPEGLAAFVVNEPIRLLEEDFRLVVFHVARLGRST